MTTADLIAEMTAIEATQSFKGHALADLRATFDALANPTNWKLPLGGIIPLADVPLARAAAEFFAGSPLEVVYEEPESLGHGRKCYVTGPGYHECIGS